MRQEVVLALLAKEPSHGYELRARLRHALGPLGRGLNAGQVYVTLTRLEKAGLVASERSAGVADRPDRKIYGLTAAGQQRVAEWLSEVELAAARPGRVSPEAGRRCGSRAGRPRRHRGRPAPRAAAAVGARPQRAAMAEPDGSDAALLLEGIVLRLQADLRWLEACERNWTDRRSES